MNIEIIYEDKDIIAVNKPAGINVHPDETYKEGTLIQLILERFPETRGVGENPLRPGVVHRLDRDTSGVLILAKNEKTFYYLKNIFKNREIKKTYTALLQGKLGKKAGETGVISLPLARSAKNPVLRVAKGKTRGEPKPAITEYKILKYFRDTIDTAEYTLVEAYPKTGRTHQLRAHFKALGNPVAGDKLYSNSSSNEKLKILGLARQALHASAIEFTLISGTRIKIEADLPDDFKNVLEKLKKINLKSKIIVDN